LQNLEVKTVPVTFNYKNAAGNTVSTVVNVEYGHTLSYTGPSQNDSSVTVDYPSQINTIAPSDYTSADGLYSYKYAKSWTSDIDVDISSTPITVPVTFTADYNEEINMADFSAYDSALNSLLNMLVDETYTVADLTKLASDLDTLTYDSWTTEQKSALDGTHQSEVDAETTKINNLASALTPATIDLSTAKAAAAAAKQAKDQDVYDVSIFDFEYTSTVEVAGIDVVGLLFANQTALDNAIASAIENLNKNVYTIYLNGTAVGTAEYGATVIVSSDGTFVKNVSDITTNDYDGDTMVAWKYSYAAPSRNNVATDAKYVVTAKSLGFVVAGDTYLTTENATDNSDGYVVKFVTNDGKTFAVSYTTDGNVTMPEAPQYAFYTFTGYDNGKSAGDVITVSENTTIVANYEVDKATNYVIDYFENISDAWWSYDDSGITETVVANYNELVSFENEDAYCWVIANHSATDQVDTYKVVAYGTSYSFYACESYTVGDSFTYDEDAKGLVAFTKDEYEMVVSESTDDEGQLSEDAVDYVVDSLGNPILAEVNVFGSKELKDVQPDVSVLDGVVPIYDKDGNFSKFSLIGSFILPEGYSIVEAGFLFSSNQKATLSVENVGTDGVARMKASRYTVGNQFVVNIIAPSSGATVSFKYNSYAIIKDADGNLTTWYSQPVMGSTQGF
jgi:hypothetical protein